MTRLPDAPRWLGAVPVTLFPPRYFELESAPGDRELVSYFAIATGKADVRFLGIEHLRLADEEPPPFGRVAPRERLVRAVNRMFLRDTRRTYLNNPTARVRTEAPEVPDGKDLLRQFPEVAFDTPSAEAHIIARDAAVHNLIEPHVPVQVLSAELPLGEQFRMACETLVPSAGLDEKDVLLWFAIRQFAWLETSLAPNVYRVPYIDRHFKVAFSSMMGLSEPLDYATVDKLSLDRTGKRLHEFTPEELKPFLFPSPPTLHAPEVQRVVASLRLSGPESVFSDLLAGAPTLVVYGRSHTPEFYEYITSRLKRIRTPWRGQSGVQLDEHPDWAHNSERLIGIDRKWLTGGPIEFVDTPGRDHPGHLTMLATNALTYGAALRPER